MVNIFHPRDRRECQTVCLWMFFGGVPRTILRQFSLVYKKNKTRTVFFGKHTKLFNYLL